MEDGSKTAPAQVSVESMAGRGAWLRVILREGKKRQIREVGTRIGLPVQRIVRVRIGTLLLGNLKPGEWRNLTALEVRSLKGVTKEVGRPSVRRPRIAKPAQEGQKPAFRGARKPQDKKTGR